MLCTPKHLCVCPHTKTLAHMLTHTRTRVSTQMWASTCIYMSAHNGHVCNRISDMQGAQPSLHVNTLQTEMSWSLGFCCLFLQSPCGERLEFQGFLLTRGVLCFCESPTWLIDRPAGAVKGLILGFTHPCGFPHVVSLPNGQVGGGWLDQPEPGPSTWWAPWRCCPFSAQAWGWGRWWSCR